MLRVFSVVLVLVSVLSGCGGSSGGSGPTPTPIAITPTPSMTPLPAPSNAVTISGNLSFDYVPQYDSGGLNYDLMESRPIRGVVVQAFDEQGQLHAQTVSNDQGNYALRVGENIAIAVRVLAELQQGGIKSWEVKVTDNTQGNAQYVMQGDYLDSGQADSVRDLHASSGWSGTRYRDQRVSAPFAILDAAYDAVKLVTDAVDEISLPPLEMRWSPQNIAVDGNLAQGEINTSKYEINEKHIYILGDENNDTDEYDRSVIQHEWSHYFEDNLSRSDSIGGAHNLDSSSDMRLAFSEGFANAFSAIASGQPLYRDSSGIRQRQGFNFSLESNGFSNAGWFSENSIGKFVYDLVDSNNESGDVLSIGYENVVSALLRDEFLAHNAFVSIYLFADQLTAVIPDQADSINAMLNREAISGRGAYGEGETNDSAANIRYVLPIYHLLAINDTVEVCGNNSSIEYNGFDNRRFIRFAITAAGDYRFTAQTSLGTGERDPDMQIHFQGSPIFYFSDNDIDFESGVVPLSEGEYILEVFDYLNIDNLPGGGTSCFDVNFSVAE